MSAGDYSIGGRVWPGLGKLMEESGEAVQAGGKIIAMGGRTAHHDGGPSLAERLEEEVADVLAAITYLIRHNPELRSDVIVRRAGEKADLFETWHARERAEER